MAKGSVRKKGKKWYYRFYVEDASGNLVQKECAGTESKSETEKLLRQAMEDYESKKFIAKADNITLGQLLDTWAEEELKVGTLSNGTVENYLGAIRCIKKHPIADRRLKTVTAEHLQTFLDLLTFGGTYPDGKVKKGLSKDYIHSFSAVLQQSFRFAVFPKQLITFNPMQYIKLKRKAEEVDLFSEEDMGHTGTQPIPHEDYEKFGKPINWQKPETYNEKINWEKINIKDERRTRLADKYLVREWIKEQIGEKYLTQLYGVWDNACDINFDKLPNQFVLKLNNGSGRNIIVKDKSKFNQVEVCQKLNEWREHNFAYNSFELHYKNIIPKIICEEYLEGLAESVYDYNIYCFHGKPEYIWCIKGSHRPGCQASFYNKKWEMQSFSYGYPKDPVLAPRPSKLEEMLKLSETLSKEFEHVRVDWYNLPDGRVLFGEMTFSTWSGLMHFEPEEYDLVFGNLI